MRAGILLFMMLVMAGCGQEPNLIGEWIGKVPGTESTLALNLEPNGAARFGRDKGVWRRNGSQIQFKVTESGGELEGLHRTVSEISAKEVQFEFDSGRNRLKWEVKGRQELTIFTIEFSRAS